MRGNGTYKKIAFWGGPVLLLALAFLGMAAARGDNGFADWYGTRVYPLIVGTLGRVLGIFPFSVVEFGLYGLVILLIWHGISHLRQIWKTAALTVWCVSALLFSYVFCCGINYSRTPFSQTAGLEVRESSREELYRLCAYLTERVIQASEELQAAEAAKGGEKIRVGDTEALSYLEAWNLGREGVAAMEKLGRQYPALAGSYPNPKPVAVSWILSVQQLSGIYAPFTVEANYNRKMTPYNIPHTVCHELSHLKGFMREDEANFIGYLACVGADSAEYRYSGYLLGWIYATNALYPEDPKGYGALSRRLPERVLRDFSANNEFWDRYEGKIAEAATQVNDAYLKIHEQEDGVKSYGRVVDLMLAYYREELE